MGIFTKIWANVWSARMEYILNNAILALLDNPGSTLLGVQRILVDKEYRKKMLANVKDPIVLAFWNTEYEQYDPRFRNEAIAPIQNKVGQFLSSSLIRNIVGQPQGSLNLYDAMNQEKIILVNVSKGRIGEDNSQLLGAMVITKIQLAAMERVRIPEEERKDFYLYVDEFQNFATDSFASILSEARKYRLNLVMAHQYIGQLVTDTSTRVRDAVFGNVGTLIVFRVGAADAEFLEAEFTPEVTIEDLVGLPNYHIYLKLMIDQVRSRPFSANTLPPLAIEKSSYKVEDITNVSRSTYARKRVDVEDEMNMWAGFGSISVPRTEVQPQAAKPFQRITPQRQEPVPVATLPIPKPTLPASAPIMHTPSPAKPLSLSTLKPRILEKEETPSSAPALQGPRRVPEKKKPERMSELRSILQGVLAKREVPVEKTKSHAQEQSAKPVIPSTPSIAPAPIPVQQKTPNNGSFQPGERIKL